MTIGVKIEKFLPGKVGQLSAVKKEAKLFTYVSVCVNRLSSKLYTCMYGGSEKF